MKLLTIQIEDAVYDRLVQVASDAGIRPDDLVAKEIVRAFPPPKKGLEHMFDVADKLGLRSADGPLSREQAQERG